MTVLPRYLRTVIPIDVGCNDERGYQSGRVVAIEFPGIELHTISLRGVHFCAVERGFWISRRRYYASHVASHVGNVCWERYGMVAPIAARFLVSLRVGGLFNIDSGDEELYRWWESNFTVGRQVEPYLSRLLSAAASEESCR